MVYHCRAAFNQRESIGNNSKYSRGTISHNNQSVDVSIINKQINRTSQINAGYVCKCIVHRAFNESSIYNQNSTKQKKFQYYLDTFNNGSGYKHSVVECIWAGN